MDLHANLHQRVVLDTPTLAWCASPLAGVGRRLLDRQGDEVARSNVLRALRPRQPLPAPQPWRGEEILVLSGVFQDERGRHGAGSWLRNPPGSAHQPWSETGCTLWVKTGHLPLTLGPDGSPGGAPG